jgi:hypothetical protein
MTTICIDTETFYSDECTVRTLGNYNYARHPDWDCYMVSIAGDNGLRFVGPPEEAPWDKVFNTEHRLISHNTGFDKAVIERLHELGIIPKPEYAVWDDTADLVCYLGMPRALKSAAKIVLGIEMSKDVRNNMKGKRYSDIPEDKRGEVLDYALGDAVHTLSIWEKLNHLWPEEERWLSRHTREMGERGLPIDKEKLDAGILSLKTQLDAAVTKIPWFERTGKVLSRPDLEAECAKHDVVVPKSLAKDNPECIAWEDEHGDSLPFIGAVRTYRRCNMLHEKLLSIRGRMRDDVFSWLSIKYFGGHTGRWSGDGGVNYQNLPRGDLFGVNIRSMIVAPPGKTFVVVDLSQIEARVTSWFAGDKETLKLIREGVDIYEAHARSTMGYNDPMPLKQYDEIHHSGIRQLAKVRVLGLGFGCGAAKFVDVARIMGGVTLTLEESDKIVRDYRENTFGVRRLWRKLESHLALHANTDQNAVFELPSGRKMTYVGVKRAGTKLSSVTCQGGSLYRKFLWGGTLTENLVQAAARDILAHYIRLLTERGFDIRMHVHDEVIILCDEAEAPGVLDETLKIMSVPPEWIADLPIAAEGGITKFYKK